MAEIGERKIESEKDLPAGNNSYFVIDKHGIKIKTYLHASDCYENKIWLENYDFWLEEKEIPSWIIENVEIK